VSEPNGHARRPGFTPVQNRILDVLRDGGAHGLDELRACLNDELQDEHNIHFHLSGLRARLRRQAQDIQRFTVAGKSLYRHVRITALHDE
jgi:hypothetical protein